MFPCPSRSLFLAYLLVREAAGIVDVVVVGLLGVCEANRYPQRCLLANGGTVVEVSRESRHFSPPHARHNSAILESPNCQKGERNE